MFPMTFNDDPFAIQNTTIAMQRCRIKLASCWQFFVWHCLAEVFNLCKMLEAMSSSLLAGSVEFSTYYKLLILHRMIWSCTKNLPGDAQSPAAAAPPNQSAPDVPNAAQHYDVMLMHDVPAVAVPTLANASSASNQWNGLHWPSQNLWPPFRLSVLGLRASRQLLFAEPLTEKSGCHHCHASEHTSLVDEQVAVLAGAFLLPLSLLRYNLLLLSTSSPIHECHCMGSGEGNCCSERPQ